MNKLVASPLGITFCDTCGKFITPSLGIVLGFYSIFQVCESCKFYTRLCKSCITKGCQKCGGMYKTIKQKPIKGLLT